MASLIPFKAVRPARNKVHLVASRPYYSYKRNILEAKLESNPFTFIHIINPEFGERVKTPPNSIQRFENVKSKYREFKQDQTLIRDEKPAFYLYRQTTPEATFTGVIAGAAVQDYLDGTIKKHEATLTEREQVFKRYLDVCGFNAEPVLLTYPDDRELENLFSKILEKRPEYEFYTTDDISHELWVIDLPDDQELIQEQFKGFENIYIADGHHRSASSALLAQEKETSTYQYFLAYYIPESQLKIYDFNRVIKYTEGLSPQYILGKLEKSFHLSIKGEPFQPEKGKFSLYLMQKWYELELKSPVKTDDPVQQLDAEILTHQVLDPIFDIHDLKTDRRIGFVGGRNCIEDMQKMVDKSRAELAFGLHPITMEELKAVAEANKVMPPKTSWIEPKLRSGLTIYEF